MAHPSQTNAPQPEVRTDDPPPQNTGAATSTLEAEVSKGEWRLKSKPMQFTWVTQVRGLNEQAQAMAASNARPKRPMDENASSRITGSLG